MEIMTLDLPIGKGASIPCSCGCGRQIASIDSWGRRRQFATGHNKRSHGCTVGGRTAEYRSWIQMRDRVKRKPEYTSRGIQVCAAWLDSFDAFFAHVGPKPTPGHTLERINNDGNYEPGNVRWATIKEQTRNRRSNRLLTIRGETRCLAEWVEAFGQNYKRVSQRLRDGWEPERALFAPARGLP